METKVKFKDYRNTTFVQNDFTLGNKKQVFMKIFRQHHPKAVNVYNTIKNKENRFNFEFRKIYHEKCAYCGISTQIIESSRFEVDHVIPESILGLDRGYTYEQINGIDNLVSSCQMCNRGKTNFFFDKSYLQLLHPDNNRLPEIFERTGDYSIVINSNYENDEKIIEFYEKLKLNNQLRRLDFLLMEMKDFCDRYDGDAFINEIQRLIIKIENKRRRNY